MWRIRLLSDSEGSFLPYNFVLRGLPYGHCHLSTTLSKQNPARPCKELCFCSSVTNCDFEENSCGWFEASKGDLFDWEWGSRSDLPAGSEQQAPPGDHTHSTTQGRKLYVLPWGPWLGLRRQRSQQTAGQCWNGSFMTEIMGNWYVFASINWNYQVPFDII